MVLLKRLVLDILKPHSPNSLDFCATLAAAARRGGVDGTALRPTGRVVAVSEVSPRRESIVGYVGFAEDEDTKRLKGGETKGKGKEKGKEKERYQSLHHVHWHSYYNIVLIPMHRIITIVRRM